MQERAYAKINLSLNVLRQRQDGYHELAMIMVPLDFYDWISMEIADKTTLSCNLRYLPQDQRNSVIQAVEAMRKVFKFPQQFTIRIEKHIPSQAGLAGGSADAAAAIRLINRMLNLSAPPEMMVSIAAQVGADVPFCLYNRPALVRGIGEQLEFFDFDPGFGIFLLKPRQGISTRQAYESLDLTRCAHPDILAMRQALIRQDYPAVLANLGNSLEQSAFALAPQLRDWKQQLLDFGFDGALVTGSGSCIFALTQKAELIRRANPFFRKKGLFVRQCRILC